MEKRKAPTHEDGRSLDDEMGIRQPTSLWTIVKFWLLMFGLLIVLAGITNALSNHFPVFTFPLPEITEPLAS